MLWIHVSQSGEEIPVLPSIWAPVLCRHEASGPDVFGKVSKVWKNLWANRLYYVGDMQYVVLHAPKSFSECRPKEGVSTE